MKILKVFLKIKNFFIKLNIHTSPNFSITNPLTINFTITYNQLSILTIITIKYSFINPSIWPFKHSLS